MKRKLVGLLLGPGLFLSLILLPLPVGLSASAMVVAATAFWMATWWISDAIPIPATALLPVVLFPLFDVMPMQQTTLAYANPVIFLFLGGFLIAVTIEKWQLHQRIALHTISLIGVSPVRILLGFMLATAFLSMWISNTATAMMMVTIGIAVIKRMYDLDQNDDTYFPANPFATVLMLGIAYAASIGGVATIIGTPPNAILAGVLERNYGVSIGFLEWMILAVPLSAVMFLLTWAYLAFQIKQLSLPADLQDRQYIHRQLVDMGPIDTPQRRVLFIFILVAVGWIVRGLTDISWLENLSDAGIALFGALLLFVIPSRAATGGRLLEWKTAIKIPWDILILFGGGFALAEGFTATGLTQWIAQQLSFLEGSHLLLLVGVITLLVVFLTEVTSNTATASLLLPVMGALAIAMQIHPLYTMIAVAIAASYAFMLPVATPPNAIVFASRTVTIAQMARTGFALNLVGVILISFYVVYVLPLIFDLSEFVFTTSP